MYDPTVGKWISEDPIGFGGDDPNLGRYVSNSPLTLVDPSGLKEVELLEKGDYTAYPVKRGEFRVRFQDNIRDELADPFGPGVQIEFWPSENDPGYDACQGMRIQLLQIVRTTQHKISSNITR